MYAEWQIRGVGGASLIQLRISEQLIRAILRLPDDVTVRDAEMAHGPPVLLLTVDMPGAPAGAASAALGYTVAHGFPDPVQLTGMRFTREDGTQITAPAAGQP
jgi:hypothetical protein